MKIFISQPTFFPWLGYFDMIDQADKFIILDDVDFSYQSWQHRNNFKTPKGLELFTVPIDSNTRKKKIQFTKLDNNDFTKKKFIKFILSNYSKSKFFNSFKDEFIEISNIAFSHQNLLEFNIEYIKWALKILNINVDIHLSSKLDIKSKKIHKIIDICKYFKTEKYITTVGSKSYIDGNEYLFDKSNIELIYHNYKHPTYNQLFGSFVDYACILDLIFNEGDKSLSVIKSGRRTY